MRLKARILLVFIAMMAAAGISGVFHRCYVIDSMRPGLPDNTPPVIDYNTLQIDGVNVEFFGTIEVEFDEDKIVEFVIGEIWDPNNEERLFGNYVIDYTGTELTNSDVVITRKSDGDGESDTLWEASFKIRMADEFEERRIYEVLVGISDRLWLGEGFDVPDDTTAAFARWIVKVEDNVTE